LLFPPFFKPKRFTDAFVMMDVISRPPGRPRVTSQFTAPIEIFFTRPANMFLALIFIAFSPC
jgi:hypothetical protein